MNFSRLTLLREPRTALLLPGRGWTDGGWGGLSSCVCFCRERSSPRRPESPGALSLVCLDEGGVCGFPGRLAVAVPWVRVMHSAFPKLGSLLASSKSVPLAVCNPRFWRKAPSLCRVTEAHVEPVLMSARFLPVRRRDWTSAHKSVRQDDQSCGRALILIPCRQLSPQSHRPAVLRG